jgi:repressor LexA
MFGTSVRNRVVFILKSFGPQFPCHCGAETPPPPMWLILQRGTYMKFGGKMNDEGITADIHEFPEPVGPGISKRAALVLQALIDGMENRGFPPSIRDLLPEVGLNSVSSVSHQITNLERHGYIRKSSNLARGIEILKYPDGRNYGETEVTTVSNQMVSDDSDSVGVPLLGSIAAGVGLVAQEEHLETMQLPRQLTGHGELFMLQVRGESMIDAGIFDGDFVVVRRQPSCDNGDIVAAIINDEEATVKTFTKRSGQVWLMPSNPLFEPIDGNNALILGVVKTVLRKI